MWRDLLEVLLLVAVWFALMKYVLPAFGIPTCMTGSCGWKPKEKESGNEKKEESDSNV